MYMTSFFVYFKWLLDKFRSPPSKDKSYNTLRSKVGKATASNHLSLATQSGLFGSVVPLCVVPPFGHLCRGRRGCNTLAMPPVIYVVAEA